MPITTTYIAGLDLGQANDYTALAVVERTVEREPERIITPPWPPKVIAAVDHPPQYALRHLERVRQVDYPEVVTKVNAILSTPALAGQTTLVIDRTGVGRGIFDMFAKAPASKIVGVTITGGEKANQDGRNWNVPKKDLVAAIQATGGTGRLRYAPTLPLAAILDKELMAFRRKLTTTSVTYEAWREGDHDDVLLALALAVWYGDRARRKWGVVGAHPTERIVNGPFGPMTFRS